MRINDLQSIGRFFEVHPLTRSNPIAAWGRFINWQVRSRLSDEIIVQWVEGSKLAARRGMAGATGNIYAGLHEFGDMMTVLHFLRPGDLFLDIGANIGSFTVLASAVCAAHTWSFEPDPETAIHLRRNIEVNGIQDLVQIHETALGPDNGFVRFTIGLDSTNRVATDFDKSTREVSVRKLDDVVSSKEPIMIKMDVEGYETSVLEGASKILAKSTLRVIELETVDSRASGWLSGHGFEPAEYDPITRKLSPLVGKGGAGNALYIRDWSFVQQRLESGKRFRILGQSI